MTRGNTAMTITKRNPDTIPYPKYLTVAAAAKVAYYRLTIAPVCASHAQVLAALALATAGINTIYMNEI